MRARWFRWIILGGLIVALAPFGAPRDVRAQTPLTVDSPEAAAGGHFGNAIAIGDVLGDRKPEIVVGAPGVDADRGRVYVIDGETFRQLRVLTPPESAPCEGEARCRFGAAVAIGDVTGDGHADIIVGAPNATVLSLSWHGRVYVFPDLDLPISGVISYDSPVPMDRTFFGAAVAAWDQDGDGRQDVIVGAPGQGNGIPDADPGHVYAFDIMRRSPIHTYTSPNSEAGGAFGAALAVGAVTGAARGDLIVGAPDETVDGRAKRGRAYSFFPFPVLVGEGFLARGVTSWTYIAPGAPVCDLGGAVVGCKFGAAVSAADVDGDGRAEVIIGAYDEDIDGVADQGRAYVFSGIPDRVLYALNTPEPGRDCERGCNRFGRAVAGGDLNGDGHAEVIIGATGEPIPGGNSHGRVYIFNGREGALLWRLDAPASGFSSFGAMLAVGDFNDDRLADFAVGVPHEWVGRSVEQGRVYLVAGQRYVRLGFEAPTLGDANRSFASRYGGGRVEFTAEPVGDEAAVVSVVRNSATQGCVEPADTNQKLGTAPAVRERDDAGLDTFPIRATFTPPLAPTVGFDGRITTVWVRVEFQTIGGATVRLRLFSADGREVAAVSRVAGPADGTCDNPGGARARTTISVMTLRGVAYAIMDTQPAGRLFVIDNVGWSP